MGKRSPALFILVSLLLGGLLALVAAFLTAPDGSEPTVTGSILLAFGLGWLLVAVLTRRFSAQPQRWAFVPAAFFGIVGLVLVVLQPAPSLMDLLSWIWPVALVVLAGWIVWRSRRELVGRGRWIVNIAAAVLILFALGGAVSDFTGTQPQHPASSTSQMVDVGGRKLYLDCTGTGSPTVILQAGLLLSSAEWDKVAPSVASSTAVCRYDRAGLGLSDELGVPQDGVAVATDLHNLLSASGVSGPYVLVGHSTGADYVRVFAGQYPSEVAGMVLVDAQPADALTGALPDYPATYQGLKLLGGVSPTFARIGLLGAAFGVAPGDATVKIARAGRDEVRAIPSVLDQARAVTTIGDVPLIVVSAGIPSQAGWAEAQAELPALSTNSSQRTIADSTHDSLVIGDDAPATTQAILDVVAVVRAGTRVH